MHCDGLFEEERRGKNSAEITSHCFYGERKRRGRRREASNSQTVFMVLNLKAKTKISFTREIKGEQFNQTQAFDFIGLSAQYMIWFLFFN